MKVRDVWKLKNGAQVVVPFDGSQPSGTDALGLLGGFLGQLGSNHKLLPISYECWPKVYSKCKEDVWDSEIKVCHQFAYFVFFKYVTIANKILLIIDKILVGAQS